MKTVNAIIDRAAERAGSLFILGLILAACTAAELIIYVVERITN